MSGYMVFVAVLAVVAIVLAVIGGARNNITVAWMAFVVSVAALSLTVAPLFLS